MGRESIIRSKESFNTPCTPSICDRALGAHHDSLFLPVLDRCLGGRWWWVGCDHFLCVHLHGNRLVDVALPEADHSSSSLRDACGQGRARSSRGSPPPPRSTSLGCFPVRSSRLHRGSLLKWFVFLPFELVSKLGEVLLGLENSVGRGGSDQLGSTFLASNHLI